MTITRITAARITAALSAPAVAAALLAGGAALGTATAQAAPTGTACVAVRTVAQPVASAANPLTRAGQLTSAGPRAQAKSSLSTCAGR